VLEHPRERVAVLLHVVVCEGHVPPFVLVTGGGRVGSGVLAVDVDHGDLRSLRPIAFSLQVLPLNTLEARFSRERASARRADLLPITAAVRHRASSTTPARRRSASPRCSAVR
jgi:hypothetical protein